MVGIRDYLVYGVSSFFFRSRTDCERFSSWKVVGCWRYGRSGSYLYSIPVVSVESDRTVRVEAAGMSVRC